MILLEAEIKQKISESARAAYIYRKQESEKRGVRMRWGRTPIPEQYKTRAIEMFKEGKTYKQIQDALPAYEIDRKDSMGAKIIRKISKTWIYLTIKEAGLTSGYDGHDLQSSPPRSGQEAEIVAGEDGTVSADKLATGQPPASTAVKKVEK